MGDTVFANGMSVLHKGSSGKSMAAMPDVCLCPPPSPAGPIPTPLPNNSLASDLERGAKSVLIEGNPAGTKSSYLKTSTGNEPSKPTGGGVVSHATKGKTYFVMHSIDVLIESEGVIRHLDMGTHNHNSPQPGNTPPWPVLAAMQISGGHACAGNSERCKLLPYKDKDKCPEGKTAHHVLPQHCFVKPGMRRLNSAKKKYQGNPVTEADIAASCIDGCGKYRQDNAPCICVTGKSSHSKDGEGRLLEHGRLHRRIDLAEAVFAASGGWTYEQAAEAAAISVEQVIPGCTAACIKAQLDDYHVNQCQIARDQPLRATVGSKKLRAEAKKILEKRAEIRTPAYQK